MGDMRPMEFAGSWYPADAEPCRRAIVGYPAVSLPVPARFAIAPHAGWRYSGALAAQAYRSLAAAGAAELVIVLGGHLGRSDPVIAMAGGQWETPFGPMPLHPGTRKALAGIPNVQWENSATYDVDNSTELQLPFAKHHFPQADLIVMRVPPSHLAVDLGGCIADYLAETKLRAVAVASTDLTHYGSNYRFTPQGQGAAALRWVREENDPAFVRAIESGAPQQVLDVSHQRHCACSAGGVVALAEVARRQNLRFTTLAYGTSADVPPNDTGNFVGYLAGVWR